MKLRRVSACFFSGLLVLISSACTAAMPRIEGVSWELFRIQSPLSGTVREELSLFIRAEDADGSSDLEEFYLLHPESRLYWRLFSDTWEKRTRGNLSWIGSSGFTGPDAVPRGEYLLVLIDRAGERAEERIYIDLPSPELDAETQEYPLLIQQGDSFLIDSSGSGPYYLLAQDSEGRILVSDETAAESFEPREYMQNAPGTKLDWYVFVYDTRGWYAGSGPY